ncbi:hypothetical protein GCM10010387_22550 [Streptomyces inusitatus]|uniref:Uncharacterized protein n=1 Tax=Streptomyces inusitatus TaxID=68221 RepID=A0A918Q0L8_9ACTN|nr:hypothetical protein [Streptomyces inusitatus]GGZ28576.1 hypothetical protein GCM10010387_22550 [Streptomyces inusitatus]
MDHRQFAMPAPDRRLIAVGVIRRQAGRTLTVRATLASVTGTISSGVSR